jgi:uncharacterized coiled-coil protein SlyX
MKTITCPFKHSTNHLVCSLALLFIPLAIGCFTFSPTTEAQCPQVCGVSFNVGFGVSQLNGVENTVVGGEGLQLNSTGSQNTVVGSLAAYALNGNGNVAIGDKVLANTITGNQNTGVGYAALSYCSGDKNIGIGWIGGVNLTTGSHNIDIGNQGRADDERTIRIGSKTQGRTFIAGISGVTVADGVNVVINDQGQLGTLTSSARFKEAIKPMDKASEAILALQPVTFRYKKELDPQAISQFGLVAEQVEKVDPDLVVRDDQGKPYTVRYEAVNAMLLNEFIKEHHTVQEQEATIGQLKSVVAKQEVTAAQQQEQIEALTADLQKVSARLEVSKAEPRSVLNNQ